MKTFYIALASVAFAASSNAAVTLAAWNFESPTTPADVTNSTLGPSVAASFGSGTLFGLHSSAATDWTTPAGNISPDSYSVNTWTVGDYFQFSTSTTGQSGVSISFDQTGSGTGPRDFSISYSTDGTLFTSTGITYTVLLNGGAPNPSWAAAGGSSAYSFSFDLSSITALDNQATVYFRLIQATTTSIGSPTPGVVATGGTSRLDNVAVSVVPEPTIAFLGGIGLIGLLRRRR